MKPGNYQPRRAEKVGMDLVTLFVSVVALTVAAEWIDRKVWGFLARFR